MPAIFISYRRQDSGTIARRLAETLARTFGLHQVFIDTDSIRVGQDWRQSIEDSLVSSSVVIAVIGPQWLRLQNDEGRRRIDLPGDWVRGEIQHAIDNHKTILPILVSGASPLTESALPDVLAQAARPQAYRLADEYWKRDVAELVDILTKLGIKRHDTTTARDVYPPRIDQAKPLTQKELDDSMPRLPEWQVVTRPGIGGDESDRIELHRAFRFRSFLDAVHFIVTASRFVQTTDHHPDWQNVWVSVNVWLTTWDIGHRPSFKDVRLAEYLETLYRDYMV